MTLEQMLIVLLDDEIEKYEAELNHLPDPVFSSKHNKAIKKAVKAANSNERCDALVHHKLKHIRVKRFVIAAFIAVFVMLSSLIAVAVVNPEYYMVVKGRIKELTITFIRGDEDSDSDVFSVRKGETPESFVLASENLDDEIYTAIYTYNNVKELIYVQQKLSDTTVSGLDSENDYKKTEVINGSKTIVMKKADCYTLFWVEGNCLYTVVGNCSMTLLKKYIESIK